MKSIWQLKILVPVMILLALSWSLLLPSPNVQAQGSPKPTPTNEASRDDGDGGNGNRRDKDRDIGGAKLNGETDGKHGGGISGYVFNYSTGGPQGGILVTLSGGSWQLETLTDSNGFYQFGNLGNGTAMLNIYMPMTFQSMTANWPVRIERGVDQTVNLGYYTGNQSPLQVELVATIQNGVLHAQIINRTNQPIANASVEVRLPDGIEASASIQGNEVTPLPNINSLRVQANDIVATGQATIKIPLQSLPDATFGPSTEVTNATNATTQSDPANFAFRPKIEVIFYYDQQLTPQLIAFSPDGRLLYGQPENQLPTEIVETTTTTFKDETSPTEEVIHIKADVATETDSQVIKSPVVEPPTAITTIEEQPYSLMPVTGFNNDIPLLNMALILASTVLGGGLVMVGWSSIKKTRR
jgi:hypothetical protein